MYTAGYNNQTKNAPKMSDIIRRRAEILQEMAEIERMQRGSLSEQFFKRMKEGREVIHGPYYVLQHWVKGKHCSLRVPVKNLAPVQNAIEGRERFEKLAQEFVEITERLTLEIGQDQEIKKKPTKSAKRSSKKPKAS
jgi:hypothetical protein